MEDIKTSTLYSRFIDFQIFRPLKKALKVNRFQRDKDIQDVTKEFFEQQQQEFFTSVGEAKGYWP